MSIDDIRNSKRDEILSLAGAHGARNVRVFGSVARGEQRPESDIDLLVDLDAGRSLTDPRRIAGGSRKAAGRSRGHSNSTNAEAARS